MFDDREKIKVDPSMKFCEHENGEHILLISNEVILQLLPKYFHELGEKVERKFEIFGASDECLKNAVYITQHFSYWLYSNHFTYTRLALYTEDEWIKYNLIIMDRSFTDYAVHGLKRVLSSKVITDFAANTY